MADIIQLLPDSVANQIAAGEVIQRPASVVKELVENAIDAGASQIRIYLKDAGRSLVQVIDNGKGMSVSDARLAFERHATSKIREAQDLFAIRTMGFRGEALASIAAIAQVDLKTKRAEDELGTWIEIAGSEVLSQEACTMSEGSNFSVKNLFYNIPVRRKFLKSNTTEFKYILQEIQRVALCNPSIQFYLNHNDTEVYQLTLGNPLKRIEQLFRKNLAQQLVPIDTETSIVSIHGYIGKPESAKKSSGEQFFFVNQRYMKHPSFHRAVVQAYERLIPSDAWPSYFIFFEIDPSAIDVNIHPTKTEIKFEDENNVWRILQLVVKEALGKFNLAPSIDFDSPPVIDIPVADPHKTPNPPQVKLNPHYNPFSDSTASGRSQSFNSRTAGFQKPDIRNWESLYRDFDQSPQPEQSLIFPSDHESRSESADWQSGSQLLHFKNRFILSSVKSGLMIIDHRRAHIRVLYERFLHRQQSGSYGSQGLLFPETFDMALDDILILDELLPSLRQLGFDLDLSASRQVQLKAAPTEWVGNRYEELMQELIENYRENQSEDELGIHEKLAHSMAKTAAMKTNRSLSQEEMEELIGQLFACEFPQYTPGGKPILHLIPTNDIEQLF